MIALRLTTRRAMALVAIAAILMTRRAMRRPAGLAPADRMGPGGSGGTAATMGSARPAPTTGSSSAAPTRSAPGSPRGRAP